MLCPIKKKEGESTNFFGAENNKIANLPIAGGLQETHYLSTVLLLQPFK